MYELTYGNLTKYWSTIGTLVVVIPLVILAVVFYGDISPRHPIGWLLILSPVASNLYMDLKNYNGIYPLAVSESGIFFNGNKIAWEDIKRWEFFGPTVRKSRDDLSIKLVFSSGVIMYTENSEIIVYASAKKYDQFISQLKKLHGHHSQ